MKIQEFLEHPAIGKIIADLNETKQEKARIAYNLFSLSSTTSHLENFHSDVIASLLNPMGLHGEGSRYLKLFIQFLNLHYQTNVKMEDFEYAETLREKGRIDIWIRDKSTRKAIVIENKMNNAVDMDDQLDRYHIYSEEIGKCTVAAIIYLSLDGLKFAPSSSDYTKLLIRNIGAFTNQQNDLVNGWLQPCFNACQSEDSRSMVYQYIKLIRHLANKQLDSMTLDRFYTFVSENNGLSLLREISELADRVPQHRADQFIKAIGNNYQPFKKHFRYKENYWLFENYREESNNFKLDVCVEVNGSVWLTFWNPPMQNEEGWKALRCKLESINLINEFSGPHNWGYRKVFSFSNETPTMIAIDQAVIAFVKDFMERLRSNQMSKE